MRRTLLESGNRAKGFSSKPTDDSWRRDKTYLKFRLKGILLGLREIIRNQVKLLRE